MEGQSFDFNKNHFKAKEVEEGKTSEYYKQKYIIGDDLYLFWISNDLDLGGATDQVESILRKPKK